MVKGCMHYNVCFYCVFYLECDKGKENNSCQIYVELYYSYVLVYFYFYKVIILSTLFLVLE
jgi:hypothetical protein